MQMIPLVLALIVALEHYYILYLEMFQITSAKAQKTFGLEKEFVQDPRVQTLFKNQGLYNGFLATGIVWGAFFAANSWGVVTFFVSCVLVAAIYGGFTSSKGILLKQGLPALITLVALLIFR
jgi:putative membrane protein